MRTASLFHLNSRGSKNVFTLHLCLFFCCCHPLPSANQPDRCFGGLGIILFYYIYKINWMIYLWQQLLSRYLCLLLTSSPVMITAVMAETQCLRPHIRPNDSFMSLLVLFATISSTLGNRSRMAYFSWKGMLLIAMDLKCLLPTSKQNFHQRA